MQVADDVPLFLALLKDLFPKARRGATFVPWDDRRLETVSGDGLHGMAHLGHLDSVNGRGMKIASHMESSSERVTSRRY